MPRLLSLIDVDLKGLCGGGERRRKRNLLVAKGGGSRQRGRGDGFPFLLFWLLAFPPNFSQKEQIVPQPSSF